MDVEIRRHMEDAKGSSFVGVYSFKSNNKSMHLLFSNTTLLAAVTLQRIQDRIYIKNVDTTGYGVGHTRHFILAILRTINPGMTCCFSNPKAEYIFNKSSQNGTKRIRSSGNLLEYWIETLGEFHEEVHVWSNHYENISHPFKTTDELLYFEDDPKEKLMKHFKGSLKEMFEALLCRTDFSSGSLVYGRSYGNKECCFNHFDARMIGIDCVEGFLRSLDFSTTDMAEKSTLKLINKFNVEIEYFRTEKRLVQREEAHVHVLSTKKKIKPYS